MTDDWPLALRTALRRGRLIVAEVPAAAAGRRAWVAVYPLPEGAFTVLHREFDNTYIDNDWCFGPDDGMTEARSARAGDEGRLGRILREWGVSPDQLTYAHRTDYPV
ncbi:hypothetical protein [Actinoplanes auranticolor]|uniref:Uncharacterized protein n=1 Tax=Actinoplanes auranticolor TaxID=47988 RepID=A0A919VKY9_9ACTN|nr:hypothetical protein [Actinoplanes auranticolor]GIM70044.1 hypothetical protein Aau02nite_39170 [Actinoplanes auranticolor]